MLVIDIQTVEPLVGTHTLTERHDAVVTFAVQTLEIEIIHPVLVLNEALQLFQLRQAYGRLHVGQSVVVTHPHRAYNSTRRILPASTGASYAPDTPDC